MRRSVARSVSRASGSLGLLAVLLGGVPVALARISTARFGGWAPWTGIAPPSEWSIDGIGRVLGDRVSESLVADVILRVSLSVVWLAVAVIAATVIAEIAHQVRHDGIGLPSMRGLGWGQPIARYIATGLLVLTPLFNSSRVGASPALPLRAAPVAAVVDASPFAVVEVDGPAAGPTMKAWTPSSAPARSVAPSGGVEVGGMVDYVVERGDSVYSIAERLAAGDRRATVSIAERILDANLGAEMIDGQRFTNAAYIETGWVLRVPTTTATTVMPTVVSAEGSAPASAPAVADRHEVAPGETLWSIADQRLGDELRWTEIWHANNGREMEGGRRFDDPHLILPGWQLDLPPSTAPTAPEVADPEPAELVPPEVADADPAELVPPEVADADPAELVPSEVADPGLVVADLAELVPPEVADADPAELVPPQLAPPPSGADAEAAVPAVARPTGAPPSTTSTTSTTMPPAPVPGDGAVDPAETGSSPAPAPIGLGQAAMLSAGLMALVAVVRNRRLRAARPRARVPAPRPRPVELERTLRSVDAAERLLRLDLALRCAAAVIAERDRQVLMARVDHAGAVELTLTGPCELPSPWEGRSTRWVLTGDVPVDLLAPVARSTGSPCVALVQLGVTADGRDLFVDLETLGTLTIDAPAEIADGVLTALATTLGSSAFAEVARLVGVGVNPAAFVAHRHVEHCETLEMALTLAADLVGSTRSLPDTTFALRSRMLGGEAWEPAVVLAASTAVSTHELPRLPEVRPGAGIAVVMAGTSKRRGAAIALDDGVWRLETGTTEPDAADPVEFVPVSVSADDIETIDELIGDASATLVDGEPPDVRSIADGQELAAPVEAVPEASGVEATGAVELDAAGSDRDADGPIFVLPPSSDGAADGPAADRFEEPAWSLMVRLLGPVNVVDTGGRPAEFQKSKSCELVAWLATHRERATRVAARTALWELDVRDETFANVVSAARRSMARLVPPPEGEEWLARTMTSQLPLHDAVVTDADLVEARLAAARLQPPELAVDTLAPAVALIRGIPFEDTAYLWPDAEGITSNLVLLATSAAAELAAHHLSLGDVDGVFWATGQGLRVLPGHEELIALRMRAHATAGDHAGVRHEWESYERVITADPWSDGEPAPKLVALRHELLSPPR